MRNVLWVVLALAACAPAAVQPAGPAPVVAVGRTSMIDTTLHTVRGFDIAEAGSLLELCINANNFGEPGYDWNADAWDPVQPAVAGVGLAGIGPGVNAWRLWRSKLAPDTFAIVVRGTIEDKPSILEDLVTTSISSKPAVIRAWPDGFLAVKLADTDKAETHLGFTYGMAVLMFAQQTGILKALHDKVPPGSKLLITGHSQGAAIATLVHAFLHYAINDPDDRYKLRNSGYSLKSYVFAQPKPGNWEFAMDFARIASSRGAAFTVNNSQDWVPQVPLAIEFFDEPGDDLARALDVSRDPPLLRGAYDVFTHTLAGLRAVRGAVAAANLRFTEPQLQRWNAMPDGMDRAFRGAVAPAFAPPNSVNYANTGNWVPVFGDPRGSPRIPPSDPLFQHHLPTYRTLMREQLGLAP